MKVENVVFIKSLLLHARFILFSLFAGQFPIKYISFGIPWKYKDNYKGFNESHQKNANNYTLALKR